MVDPKLLDYIKKELAKGISKEQLKELLVKAKWPLNEIDAAIKEVEQQTKPQETQQTVQPKVKEPLTQKPVSGLQDKPKTETTTKKNIPPALYVLAVIGLLIILGTGFFLYSYLDNSESKQASNEIKTQQEVMLLAKSFCIDYCKKAQCDIFKKPEFTAEELKDKNCADLEIECSKCT